jgi:hypothetical protein
MPENHRGIIAKRILQHVNIGSTQTAKGDFDLYLQRPADRFIDLADFDVAWSGRILHESFHTQSDSEGAAAAKPRENAWNCEYERKTNGSERRKKLERKIERLNALNPHMNFIHIL